jgi:hypothetical protein
VFNNFQDDGHGAAMAYKADLQTETLTGYIDISDPKVYAAKEKNDPDAHSLFQAMNGEFAEQYMEAMKKEIHYVISQKTWKVIPREGATRVSISTWVFKLEPFPDGSASKFKDRFCVRDDMQKEGIDYFETYPPVVQLSTICLVLILVFREV